MKSESTSSVSLAPAPPQSAGSDLSPTPAQPHTVRNGLLCSLLFAVCFWICWPVAQMGFIDDWSYIKSAQVFAQTGHFVFNGWATAMLGWQLVWGALFIHLFGFSFMAVKLSTLPLAMACVFLFYLIQIRFGIRPANAVFGTLSLGLSPLFLPLAASFMSDIPGLFVILLCLYCCQRALAASTDKAAIAWLCFAATSNIAGGTTRQIAWLGALVMVPCTAWLLRKRPGIVLAAALLWIATLASILYCLHWFARQPYSIAPSLFKAPTNRLGNPWVLASFYLLGEFFCLLLIVFPILIAWLPRFRSPRGTTRLAIACIVLLWVLFQMVANWTLPWLTNLLTSEFSAFYSGQFLLPRWACLLFSALIAAAFLLLFTTARAHFRAAEDTPRLQSDSQILWLLVPYSLGYCALLFLLALQAEVDYDRYILGLMPAAIVLLIRLYELQIAPRLPVLSIAATALYALLAIAGTHDLFALQRARLAAIAELRAAGIPRPQIQGGFEYDGWTQLEFGGHINDPRIKIPEDAYHPNINFPRFASRPCVLDFQSSMPALHPAYTVVFPSMPCLAPSSYPEVEFSAWVPPFRRTVYVQQFPSLAAASIARAK